MIDKKNIEMHKTLQFLKPMGFNDYNALPARMQYYLI
jgi:UDP-N-acetylglucosamine 2-epimerase (non-hydrolysing)